MKSRCDGEKRPHQERGGLGGAMTWWSDGRTLGQDTDRERTYSGGGGDDSFDRFFVFFFVETVEFSRVNVVKPVSSAILTVSENLIERDRPTRWPSFSLSFLFSGEVGDGTGDSDIGVFSSGSILAGTEQTEQLS